MTQIIHEYDNLIGRPPGRYLRMGAKLSKGIRSVQLQIPIYAAEWRAANQLELEDSTKPLWVVLGDSMAQGIGAERFDHGWPGYLRQVLKAKGKEYRMVNLSISGARTSDLLHRQIPAMQSLGEKPGLVTMMIGSNDLARKRYRQQAPAFYAEILKQLPKGSVVANLPGRGLVQDSIDRQLHDYAERGEVTLVDMRRQGPRNWRGRLASDHFHPNDAGYQALAAVFARAMGL